MYMDPFNYTLYERNNSNGVNLVEIDDLIAPSIAILNEKGYKTEFCCSGHFPIKPYGYILFDGVYDIALPPLFKAKTFIQISSGRVMTNINIPATYDYASFMRLHILLYEAVLKLPKGHKRKPIKTDFEDMFLPMLKLYEENFDVKLSFFLSKDYENFLTAVDKRLNVVKRFGFLSEEDAQFIIDSYKHYKTRAIEEKSKLSNIYVKEITVFDSDTDLEDL